MSPLMLLVLDPDLPAGGDEALPTGLALCYHFSGRFGLWILDYMLLFEWEGHQRAECLS